MVRCARVLYVAVRAAGADDSALGRINFLTAMNQSEVALEKITALKAQHQQLLHADSGHAQHRLEYARLFDVLVFQALLPSESVATVREVIYSDEVLDEISKQVLCAIVA